MGDFKRLLVVVDENEQNRAALNYAKLLMDPNDARLTVVNVNAFIETHAWTLSDIIDENELRSLLLKQRTDQIHRLLQCPDATLAQSAEVKVLDGVPFIHPHAVFADAAGRAFGGHLNHGSESWVIEVRVEEYTGTAPVRTFDETTGLSVWNS